MDESDIKVEVLAWIRRASRGRKLPVVTCEFSLNGTGIRADIALLQGSFYGIEIKSAADTLKRLARQMEGYARYFDRTVLVVAPKHLRHLNDIDLKDAQVWSQSALAEQQLRRRGHRRVIPGNTLLGLLSADEERRAIRAMSHDDEAPRAQPGVDRARTEFEKAFRRRYEPTSSAFWSQVAGRQIRREDLALLSRFSVDRQRLKAAKAAEDAHWAGWVANMEATAQAV